MVATLEPVSTSRSPLTRAAAAEAAKWLYHGLVERARGISSIERGYIDDVAGHWTPVLEHLAASPVGATLSPREARAIESLQAVVTSANLDDDATARWLSAYPSAIVRLLRTPTLMTTSGFVSDEAAPDSRASRVA